MGRGLRIVIAVVAAFLVATVANNTGAGVAGVFFGAVAGVALWIALPGRKRGAGKG